MSTRPFCSRARPVASAQDQARPEPGHLVRVTILPRRLTALLVGLVVAAISLVRSPEQQEPESLTHVILRGHKDQVNAVAFAPDGRTLAWNGSAACLTLWDVDRGQARATLRGHSGWIRSVAFAPDGQTLVSGGADATVRLWDAPPATLSRQMAPNESSSGTGPTGSAVQQSLTSRAPL
jgi:WD40 repeat protein